MRIAVIADTHNLLRPEAEAQLRASDHIIHAGDICDAQTLARIAALAPLHAVRGNNDDGQWAAQLPDSAWLQFGAVRIYVIHDLKTLRIDPRAEGARVVISGHSHKPSRVERDGVLYLNPGSAGPRRFQLPIAMAELRIDGDAIDARLTELA